MMAEVGAALGLLTITDCARNRAQAVAEIVRAPTNAPQAPAGSRSGLAAAKQIGRLPPAHRGPPRQNRRPPPASYQGP
jgi:hypothetical protein